MFKRNDIHKLLAISLGKAHKAYVTWSLKRLMSRVMPLFVQSFIQNFNKKSNLCVNGRLLCVIKFNMVDILPRKIGAYNLSFTKLSRIIMPSSGLLWCKYSHPVPVLLYYIGIGVSNVALWLTSVVDKSQQNTTKREPSTEFAGCNLHECWDLRNNSHDTVIF